jgi:hypothetical protein
MAMVQRLAFRGRRITNPTNEHSFQFYNAMSGMVLFTAPTWWPTMEEAESAMKALRTRFIADALRLGYEGKRPTAAEDKDWIDLYEDESKPIPAIAEMAASGKPGFDIKVIERENGPDIVAAGHEDAESMFAEDAPFRIMGVLAIHKDTGKYGFCLMTSTGETLLRPQQWYETPKEAYEASKTNKRVRELVEHELKKRGLAVTGYFDGMDALDNVTADEATTALEALKSQILDKVKDRPNIPGARTLGGFMPEL